MTKEEVEDLLLRIAEECDSNYRQLGAKVVAEGMRSGGIEFPFTLPRQDGLAARDLFKDSSEQISRLLAEHFSHDEVCDIAAKYILKNTVNRRLSVARAQGMERDREIKARLQYRVQESSNHIQFLKAKNGEIPAATRREQAKRGGLAKYSVARKAREFIQSEWVMHRAAYDNNKSEFARIYARLIFNEFRKANGEPLSVTVKQIRDVWLSDSQFASRPARQPVGR